MEDNKDNIKYDEFGFPISEDVDDDFFEKKKSKKKIFKQESEDLPQELKDFLSSIGIDPLDSIQDPNNPNELKFKLPKNDLTKDITNLLSSFQNLGSSDDLLSGFTTGGLFNFIEDKLGLNKKCNKDCKDCLVQSLYKNKNEFTKNISQIEEPCEVLGYESIRDHLYENSSPDTVNRIIKNNLGAVKVEENPFEYFKNKYGEKSLYHINDIYNSIIFYGNDSPFIENKSVGDESLDTTVIFNIAKDHNAAIRLLYQNKKYVVFKCDIKGFNPFYFAYYIENINNTIIERVYLPICYNNTIFTFVDEGEDDSNMESIISLIEDGNTAWQNFDKDSINSFLDSIFYIDEEKSLNDTSLSDAGKILVSCDNIFNDDYIKLGRIIINDENETLKKYLNAFNVKLSDNNVTDIYAKVYKNHDKTFRFKEDILSNLDFSNNNYLQNRIIHVDGGFIYIDLDLNN